MNKPINILLITINLAMLSLVIGIWRARTIAGSGRYASMTGNGKAPTQPAAVAEPGPAEDPPAPQDGFHALRVMPPYH